MTCGECKYINGVCLSTGFCDKFFHEVRTDRVACSFFGKPTPVKLTHITPAIVAPTAPIEPIPQPHYIEPSVKRKRSHSLIGKLTPEERLKLITDYHSVPMGDLAARYGVSRKCLLRTLKEMGVTLRKRGQATKEGKAKQMAGVKGYFENRRNQKKQ